MKNVVTVGGGTGSYTVLTGLKELKNISISALVSMADNGGSTGVLRDELGVLPPGDVRQCLVALSEHSDIVRKLMNYRFSEGGLSGHSFGNIFLAALEKVTGDFAQGVEIISEILKVNGKVIPVTKNRADLQVLCKNGDLIMGETNIEDADLQNMGVQEIFYKNSVELNEHARQAIQEADYVIIGPGNYYSSVIPNLIVGGFKEAIASTKAKLILPVNLTNKHGHTGKWQVSDYVKNIEMYLGKKVDFILVNTESPSQEQVERYKLEEGGDVLVEDDLKDERVVREPLMSHTFFNYDSVDARKNARSFIRHDSSKLAQCISKIINN